jgi:hypothetical protein
MISKYGDRESEASNGRLIDDDMDTSLDVLNKKYMK